VTAKAFFNLLEQTAVCDERKPWYGTPDREEQDKARDAIDREIRRQDTEEISSTPGYSEDEEINLDVDNSPEAVKRRASRAQGNQTWNLRKAFKGKLDLVPISAFSELSSEMQSRFGAHGIKTLEDLAATNPVDIYKLFGKDALAHLITVLNKYAIQWEHYYYTTVRKRHRAQFDAGKKKYKTQRDWEPLFGYSHQYKRFPDRRWWKINVGIAPHPY
jgi:hypothetical protein